MHYHHAKHWGVAHMHRPENLSKLPLHLIEVQSGSYLGEDDIVRFDDHYGRPH